MTATPSASFAHDPELDLLLERLVDVPVELVWTAWTEPEHLKAWFAPKPYETIECEIDLRPGGIFRTVMRDPEGTVFDNGAGCYLEVEPPHRLVWTSALGPGFRPIPFAEDDAADTAFHFTAELTFEAVGDSTRYSARAIHATRDAAQAHEKMGFSGGWSIALDQLAAHMTSVASPDG
jgi:uncharacterized protein YndB with AHSA1/START domain